MNSPESSPSPRVEHLSELSRVWECLDAHSRAEDAALKRIADLEMQRAQLKDVAQVSYDLVKTSGLEESRNASPKFEGLPLKLCSYTFDRKHIENDTTYFSV